MKEKWKKKKQRQKITRGTKALVKGWKKYENMKIFKNMKYVILFDMFLNPYFIMTTSFTNIAKTTTSTSKSVY